MNDKDTALKRTISVDNFGWHLELEARHVLSVLDKSGMGQAKAVVTLRNNEASGAATAAG